MVAVVFTGAIYLLGRRNVYKVLNFIQALFWLYVSRFHSQGGGGIESAGPYERKSKKLRKQR